MSTEKGIISVNTTYLWNGAIGTRMSYRQASLLQNPYKNATKKPRNKTIYNAHLTEAIDCIVLSVVWLKAGQLYIVWNHTGSAVASTTCSLQLKVRLIWINTMHGQYGRKLTSTTIELAINYRFVIQLSDPFGRTARSEIRMTKLFTLSYPNTPVHRQRNC